MTKEQAIKIIRRYECNSEHYEACEIAIKALEQSSYNSIKTELKPCEDAISRTEVIKSIDEREDVNGKVDAESVRTDIVLMQPVNPQKCDACEVGNPCLYCRHEFEPQERNNKK